MNYILIKKVLEILEPLATVLAIIFGGVWTYVLFIKNRQNYPKAKLSHQIFSENISKDKVLLRIKVKITNIGQIMLSIKSCKTWIQQINPLTEDIQDLINENSKEEFSTEISWPLIQKKILNPMKKIFSRLNQVKMTTSILIL